MSISPAVGFDTHRQKWTELAFSSRRIFSTPEWADAWWEVYGAGRSPHILAVSDPSEGVIALVPLYVQRRYGMRVVRFIGHGAADEMGPVSEPWNRQRAGEAVSAWAAAGRLPADIFVADDLPEVEGWDRHLGGTLLSRTRSPSLTFGTLDWQAYLQTLSANARSQLGRRERRLWREQAARYRVTTDISEIGRDLEAFFRLHAARWGSASSLLGRRSFYRRFCELALARGWLRLSFLEIDAIPIASSLDFRYADVQFQYNSGRDPAWDRYSPGIVLRVMCMREALQEGAKEYRFLRGAEPYKMRFATEDRSVTTRAMPLNGRGRVATAIAGHLAGSGRGRQTLRWLSRA